MDTSKTLSRVFKKVDDENFEIIESRETTSNINFKLIKSQLVSFKKDITNKLQARTRELQTLENAVKTYNGAIDDLEKAKADFGYDYETPTKQNLEEMEAVVLANNENE